MGMIPELLNRFGEASFLMITSGAMVASAWFLALWQIWKARHAPLANQAFVASLAIVIGQVLLIFHQHLPIDVLTFFIATAQVVMAISLVKIFRWGSHLTYAESKRATVLEKYRMSKDGLLKTYGSSLLVVTLSGLVYFALVWLEQGHIY